MKIEDLNFRLIITLVLLVGLYANPLQAASVYYTFEGYIDNFGSDASGEAANIGLGLFVPVSYTIEIDFAAAGSRAFSGGDYEEFTELCSSCTKHSLL